MKFATAVVIAIYAPGIEPGTFGSVVRVTNHYAIQSAMVAYASAAVPKLGGGGGGGGGGGSEAN
ncbi:unnamed protein product [Plutella xylostella]|uniref:(diamondback moth) hypothetical protein n=1 Tax=Plutella xylostella TaxID=51655 RepID=A0A8S4G140_PLUXY|nr:unnamed protein product [Plutella xylostella]